jgi:hypothetical protein
VGPFTASRCLELGSKYMKLHSNLDHIQLQLLTFFPLLQRDTIIEIFYERHLDCLVDVIASSCSPRSICLTSNSDGVSTNVEVHRIKPEILLSVCELLCFCVVHHPYRIKYYMQTSAFLLSGFSFLYICTNFHHIIL